MKHFLSSAAIVALSFLAVGCSNEDAVVGTTEGQFTTFVGGMSSAPTTRVQLNENGSVSASTLTELTTRTMMDHYFDKHSEFYWNQGDEIYVKVNNEYKSSDKVTGEWVENFKFHVDGVLTENQYTVYYVGANSPVPSSGADAKVNIATEQKIESTGDTKHFSTSGDCGVAKATKQADGTYSFKLDHKAAYVNLLFYVPNPEDLHNYKVKSAKVTSTNNIAGDYTLSENGLAAAGSNSNSITITHTNGQNFEWRNFDCAGEPNYSNEFNVVVAPGEHQFTVEFTVYDERTQQEKTIQRKYQKLKIEANKLYDIPFSLSSQKELFSGTPQDVYKTWDEAKAAGNLPTANEMAWYIEKGLPRRNYATWRAFGRSYDGGIWLKSLEQIAQENGKSVDELKKAAPDGTDLATTRKFIGGEEYLKRDAYATGDFFVPLTGSVAGDDYTSIIDAGNTLGEAYYWTSTENPENQDEVYVLYFDRGTLIYLTTKPKSEFKLATWSFK